MMNEYPMAYAMYNKNLSIREKSSSGGIFYLLADEVLNKDGVVFGAKFNEKWELKHSYCTKKSELEPFLGSKYIQSDIGNMYKQAKQMLDEDKEVIFSGTPCQIGGLKSYLRKEYENLLTVDFICHGVPSKMVWRRFLEENYNINKIEKINFRDKKYGWKGFRLHISTNDGVSVCKERTKDPFMKGFLQNIYLRPSCYDCRFKGYKRNSDITLGDFWGVEDICNEMFNDKGTSLILINSNKGHKYIDNIWESVEYKAIDLEKAILANPAAINSVQTNKKRVKFYSQLNESSITKQIEVVTKISIGFRIKRKIKSLFK